MPSRPASAGPSPRALAAAVAAATGELAGQDPVIARLVEAAGPCQLGARRELSHFGALARSITFQQLAGKAASTIFGRFVHAATAGGSPVDLTPEGVLALPEEAMRASGLSAAKTRSIRALAERTATGELPLEDVHTIGDEELIERLSAVPGIGRWTAEMFLMFQLGRLDVWPVGDLGVRKGYGLAWGLADMPTPKELDSYGETFRPYRSVAAWYCWRVLDTVVPDSASTPLAPPTVVPARKSRKPSADQVPAVAAPAKKAARKRS